MLESQLYKPHKRPILLTSFALILLLGWLSFPSYATSLNAGSLITNTSQGESNKIAVQLTQGCITALKHHIKTDCPTYDKLSIYDNTTSGYFGKFVNDTGFVHRSKAVAPNYYNIVNVAGWVVGVDPTEQFLEGSKTKTIIVGPPGTLSSFALDNQAVGQNHTRIEYHNIYVDNSCTYARISYTPQAYSNVIKYLESGCTNVSLLGSTINATGNKPFTFDNPYSTLHLSNYISTIMNSHSSFTGNHTAGGLGPTNCITHQCSYKDPYKKEGW